jgi:CRP-like cAMP-binding protein
LLKHLFLGVPHTCDLNSCFLCKSCLPEWRELIALKKHTVLFKKGKALFAEKEAVKGIFFMYAGAVKVYKQWTDRKELILRFAKKGDIVGHRGLGGDDTYPIGATALVDTKACFISNEFLEATLKANPYFTYTLMQFYAKELQRAEKRMRNLAHMEVKGRIADALLELSGVFGLDSSGFISVPVTRQDIASYAGTTYETVFKFLGEMSRLKLISGDGKKIRINQAGSLRKFIVNSGH